jgi:hypothetical protein
MISYTAAAVFSVQRRDPWSCKEFGRVAGRHRSHLLAARFRMARKKFQMDTN